MSEEKTELDPLAPKIEEALILSGMSQTRFGYQFFGDPAFIMKMRRGRIYRTKMVERIEKMFAEVGI